MVYRIIDKVNGRVLPGFKDTYNEGEVIEAPNSHFVVTAQVTGPDNAFFEGYEGYEGNHEYQAKWYYQGPAFQLLPEDPETEDPETPNGEETKDAAKNDDVKRSGKKTLAKTGAGLGIAVLASGLVGSGAVLARRRNA